MLAGRAENRRAEVEKRNNEGRDKELSMEEREEKGAMSRTVFIDTFKKVVGMTPGNYVAHWRIGAAQLLILQGKPMHWVLDHVGYESYSGFSKVFRKITGVSPRQWMALKKEADEREL